MNWIHTRLFGKRSRIIKLADFSHGFRGKRNESPLKESDRSFGATRSTRKLQWKNVDKRRRAFSPTKSRATGSRKPRTGIYNAKGGSNSQIRRSDQSITTERLRQVKRKWIYIICVSTFSKVKAAESKISV